VATVHHRQQPACLLTDEDAALLRRPCTRWHADGRVGGSTRCWRTGSLLDALISPSRSPLVFFFIPTPTWSPPPSVEFVFSTPPHLDSSYSLARHRLANRLRQLAPALATRVGRTAISAVAAHPVAELACHRGQHSPPHPSLLWVAEQVRGTSLVMLNCSIPPLLPRRLRRTVAAPPWPPWSTVTPLQSPWRPTITTITSSLPRVCSGAAPTAEHLVTGKQAPPSRRLVALEIRLGRFGRRPSASPGWAGLGQEDKGELWAGWEKGLGWEKEKRFLFFWKMQMNWFLFNS